MFSQLPFLVMDEVLGQFILGCAKFWLQYWFWPLPPNTALMNGWEGSGEGDTALPTASSGFPLLWAQQGVTWSSGGFGRFASCSIRL